MKKNDQDLASLSSPPPPSSLPSSPSPPSSSSLLRKLVVFFCLPPNLTFFIGIGLWLKTGPSILGFCFGTLFTTGFLGFVFFNSLPETFERLCCKTFSTRFPAPPWPVCSPHPSTASLLALTEWPSLLPSTCLFNQWLTRGKWIKLRREWEMWNSDKN